MKGPLLHLIFWLSLGYVDENADIGTKVTDETGNDVVFVVLDADRVSQFIHILF